jgi:hypothetical protein
MNSPMNSGTPERVKKLLPLSPRFLIIDQSKDLILMQIE